MGEVVVKLVGRRAGSPVVRQLLLCAIDEPCSGDMAGTTIAASEARGQVIWVLHLPQALQNGTSVCS